MITDEETRAKIESALPTFFIHEASHGTVALALHVPVKWLDVFTNDDGLNGVCQHGPTTPEYDALIGIAGSVGETLAYGEGRISRRDAKWLDGKSDDELKTLARRAAAILRDNWECVTTLAEALRQKMPEPLMAEDFTVNYRS